MKKVKKNLSSPGGRKDWKGRSPRWRLSLTNSQLQILVEIIEYYADKHPGIKLNPDYESIFMRIQEAASEIEKPLMKEIQTFPLLEGDWKGE